MTDISVRLLPWFEQHGRKDLPWQVKNAYRVWLSEIMLQQTQVATVIPYYQRFVEHFPDVHSLASADLDEVLQHWSGLGYYARARNLHRAAGVLVAEYSGEFPQSLDELIELPGVGRSTAAAILSLTFGLPHAILDGNVKRVLARVYQVKGWPGSTSTQKQLWKKADQQTPEKHTAAYNQAMMDLGSIVCTRRNPACLLCPLNDMCQSQRDSTQHDFPESKAKKPRPLKHRHFLFHTSGEYVLLEKRPTQGIWGGLWSLPELEDLADLSAWQLARWGCVVPALRHREKLLTHAFSHFDLEISLAEFELEPQLRSRIAEEDTYLWIDRGEIETKGLPAPVRKILTTALAE